MRPRLAPFVIAAVIVAAAATAPVTLARFTDQAASTISFSTDTLAPPTGLAASGTVSTSLSWTPSSSGYTAGYEVLRSTTSGSGYSLVKTVTPGSATATTDAPGNGTFYYVLRSSFQNWRSVNSNQAAITLSNQTSTGYKACTAASNAADTGGNGDGYESTPGNACVAGGGVATDASSGTNNVVSCSNAGKDRHRWWDFGLGVPASVTSVDGIALRADFGMNNNGGTTLLCAQLSWDGGSSWTAIQSVTPTGAALTTYAFGGAADTWGHTWTGSQLSNANFRLRIIDATSQTNKDFRLDYLAVNVTYTP